jgi:hypothetical protein
MENSNLNEKKCTMAPEGLGLNTGNKAARLELDCGLMNSTNKIEREKAFVAYRTASQDDDDDRTRHDHPIMVEHPLAEIKLDAAVEILAQMNFGEAVGSMAVLAIHRLEDFADVGKCARCQLPRTFIVIEDAEGSSIGSILRNATRLLILIAHQS